MRPFKTLLVTAIGTISVAGVLTLAQESSGGPQSVSTIEITDAHGTKHVVMDYENGSRFFRAGLPFDDNITDDYDGKDYHNKGDSFWARAKSLKTAIAVELHTPEDQARIVKVALSRGMRESERDNAHVVLLIPLPSLDLITFTQTRSVVRLAGEQPFDAGAGFWKLYGKENLGSLGTANFSADLSEIKAIRSLAAPVAFVGDFGFFGSTEVPFSARVTDTAGVVTFLKKALYCTTGTFDVPRVGYYGSIGLNTVRFKSTLDAKVGGTSSLSIPPAKLRSISLGRVDQAAGGYDAKAVLRTGENVDLIIVPSNGIYVPNGIVGASSKGWVWIPWYAVASIEFDDK